jgi:ribosomal protein S18 acetylase RimI-like enzyme
MVQIINAQTDAQYQHARYLFVQYAANLGFDLEFQGFSRELATLPGDYRPPLGCILLAKREREYVGCVALRPFENQICEMKRLFVIPEHRGQNIGRSLACTVIDGARDMGYVKMRLDTVESMKAARSLYQSLNFRKIQAYCFNPLENPSYMELDL